MKKVYYFIFAGVIKKGHLIEKLDKSLYKLKAKNHNNKYIYYTVHKDKCHINYEKLIKLLEK